MISDAALRTNRPPWKSQLDAKLTVQRRPLWLPGSAQAHRVFHSPVAAAPSTHPPTPCAPRRRQNLLSGGESGLHIINCNNWQVGHWLLASNPPGAHEKNQKKKNPWMLHSSYLVWAWRRFMSRNKLWAGAVLGE